LNHNEHHITLEKEMRRILFILIAAMLVLVACTSTTGQEAGYSAEATLLVNVGDTQQSFNVEDLGALPSTESTFKDVAYKGVTVSDLLDSLSFDPDLVTAVKAVASDGFTVNYDPAQIFKDNVIVAYALADGSPMTADDGEFRMVFPDEEGKLNPRMLVELQIVQ
jgi:hypothetical protein